MYNHSLKALVQGYVQVCNEAMNMNKDRFPFKQILSAARDCGRDIDVQWCVRDEGEEEIFLIRFSDERIVARLQEAHHAHLDGGCWTVDALYLNDVLEDPEVYIQNPAKMNWEWMQGIALHA